MFRWAKPPQHWHAVEISEVTDPIAAIRIEKAIHKLPSDNQVAVRWSYVFQGPPRRVANSLGVTHQALADMVHDGRSMLIEIIRR